MPLTRLVRTLPWQVVFQTVYGFRRFVFARDPPPVDHVVVQGADPEEVQRLLLSRGLVKGDSASYHYYDEDLNMVMGMYKDDEYEWYQYHVRGFDVEEGTRLRPHTELYWRMYPKEHINLVNIDVEEGIEVTAELLEEFGLEYDVVRIRPERAATPDDRCGDAEDQSRRRVRRVDREA